MTKYKKAVLCNKVTLELLEFDMRRYKLAIEQYEKFIQNPALSEREVSYFKGKRDSYSEMVGSLENILRDFKSRISRI